MPDACVAGYACTNVPAAATRDVFYSYDNRGLALTARFDSPSGEGITNTYDGAGRLTATANSMGGTVRDLITRPAARPTRRLRAFGSDFEPGNSQPVDAAPALPRRIPGYGPGG